MTSGIIKKAVDAAMKSTYSRPYSNRLVRVGAVVFKGQRIFSWGYNQLRSNGIHPKYKSYHISLHAEQDALLGLKWGQIKGHSILIVRINMNGEFLLAKPCQMCSDLIKYVGIKDVYYTTNEGEIMKEKL